MFRQLPIGAVLRLGIPLALAASGNAIRMFCDRLMLSWESSESLRASMPAGITSFLAVCIFLGIGLYSQTLAAHALGSRQRHRIGACLWQGIWAALIGGGLLALIAPATPWFYHAIGHEPTLAAAEGRYTAIMVGGGVWTLLAAILSGFWTARNHTLLVVVVSLGQAALNVLLNWILIFGHWGSPAYGIDGAAWATIAAEIAGVIVYLALFLSPEHRRVFGTWPRRTFDPALFRRLVRFGTPQGVQMFLDLGAFNLFILLLVLLPEPQVVEASTIAFSVNIVAIIPIFGFCRAISVLVGQAVGGDDRALARRTVRAGLVVATGYGAVLTAVFLLLPGLIVGWFARDGDVHQADTLALATVMLVFVAAWMLFDGLWQVYAHALQAAGDTRFAMLAAAGLAWSCLVPPTWWLVSQQAPWWAIWSVLVAYIFLGFAVFARRWTGNAWERHEVLDHGPLTTPERIPA